jgi:hypothetical protein
MRTRSLFFLLLLSVLAVGARAQQPAPTVVSAPSVFSYVAPSGWVTISLPNSVYPTAVENPNAADPKHVKAFITITNDTSSNGLTAWCTQTMAKNKAQFALLNATVGPLEPFTTTAGANAYRATVDLTARGKAVHYFLYFFAGSNDAKITVTCACASSDVAHYAPLFETAMKTFIAN